MKQDNDFPLLGKCENFCSECRIALNSIYSLGTALSVDECESAIDTELKDCNNLVLNERVETSYKDIINKNDEKFNNSQSKLPLSTPGDKCKDSVAVDEEIQVLLNKKFVKSEKNLNEWNKIFEPQHGRKCCTYVKPRIIEDKILQTPEKLKINDIQKQKLQISNYKCDYSKCSTSFKTIKNIDKIYEDSINHSKDLKNIYGIEKQGRQLTDISCIKIPMYSKSKNTENESHDTMASNYFLQYGKLKSTILNRQNKVSSIAKNLLTMSTYLNGICKTILKREDPKASSIQPNKSFDSSKKVDKSTSPILFSKTYSMVKDLAPSQENSHDMYRYNPYHFRNSLQRNK